MENIEFKILFVAVAYFLGSINSAILVSQAAGLPDPRNLGSGNPGATNVLRTGNKAAAAITLLGDLLKGFMPVVLTGLLIADIIIISVVGLAALLGHMYPIYYKFKGGKGVATLLGVLLGIDWILGLVWIAVWLSIAYLTRYSSLAALASTLIVLIASWFLYENTWFFLILLCMTTIVYWRHRVNIHKLLTGQENKIGN